MASDESTCKAITTTSSPLDKLDGKIPEIKGSRYVNFAFELEGTHNLTENKENIKGGFQAPILSRFLDGGFQFPNSDDKIKKELYKYFRESGFELTQPGGKLSQNVDEMTTGIFYASAPSMENDFEVCLLNSLSFAMFYFLDDNFDRKRKDSEEFILSTKAIFQFMDIFIDIYEGNPIDCNVLKQLESEVNYPEMSKVLNCIFTLAKKVNDLLKSKSSICSEEKIWRYYIEGTRYSLLNYAWHHKYLLKNENLSDAMSFQLRVSATGVRNVVEIWALSKDVHISDKIRQDPIFHRVYNATEIIVSLLNDIFSFCKEISKGEFDNIIMYKCRQGLTLEKAFEFVQERLTQEHWDYSNFSEKLRQVYSTDSNLQKFVDIFDYFVTCSLPLMTQLPRYNQTKCWINGVMIPKAEFKF